MGAKPSVEDTKSKLSELVKALENKLEYFEMKVRAKRGDSESDKTEVTGGRTIMRLSEIRVGTDTGVDEQIIAGISDFMNAAQGSIDGDDQGAKKAAVKGAENILKAGINALLGVSNGQSMQKESFVVLFMNNAFVRVDYYLYSYSVSEKKFGQVANESGLCYMTDLAVLDAAKLQPMEIDFLLSQTLSVPQNEMMALSKLKVGLALQAALSRVLQRKDLTMQQISEVAKELGKAQKEIDDALSGFASFSLEDDLRMKRRRAHQDALLAVPWQAHGAPQMRELRLERPLPSTPTFADAVELAALALSDSGGITNGFNASAQGLGSLTGITVTAPPMSRVRVTGKLQTLALTSQDVDTLNKYIDGLVSASARRKKEEYEKKHVSANLSWFAMFSGGGSASYEQTKSMMESVGLTEQQVTDIIKRFSLAATKMNHVQVDFDIQNTSMFPVSGNLQLYTIAGKVMSGQEQHSYQMLSDQGTLNGNPATKATGHVGPIS